MATLYRSVLIHSTEKLKRTTKLQLIVEYVKIHIFELRKKMIIK